MTNNLHNIIGSDIIRIAGILLCNFLMQLKLITKSPVSISVQIIYNSEGMWKNDLGFKDTHP